MAELVQDLLMWSETCGHILDSNDPMFGKLVRDFAAVEKEAAARIQARNRGDASVTPTPTLPQRHPFVAGRTLPRVQGAKEPAAARRRLRPRLVTADRPLR